MKMINTGAGSLHQKSQLRPFSILFYSLVTNEIEWLIRFIYFSSFIFLLSFVWFLKGQRKSAKENGFIMFDFIRLKTQRKLFFNMVLSNKI